MNSKGDFKSRIINLQSLVTGKANKTVNKVIGLLDSGNEKEKSEINSIDKDWIVLVFECDDGIYGGLVISKDVNSDTASRMSDVITSYFKRLVPTTQKSGKKCEDVLTESFPSIFKSNVLQEVYKF